MEPSGDYVVVWEDEQVILGIVISAMGFHADGSLKFDEFKVKSTL